VTEDVLANWNGQQMPLSEVRVSVLDRAFLFGDAVYEVARVFNGRLFRMDDHMERLASSLDKMKIKFDALSDVRKHVNETLANSGVKEGIVYIQITRGEAPRKHRFPENAKPNVLIYVDHFSDPIADLRATGIPVITYPDIRWGRNDIKQTGLTGNCMAAQSAFEKGCAEAVLVDRDGVMTEGTHTSIFGVKLGTILSPPESNKVLPSVTKKVVLELAHKHGIPVMETWVETEEIYYLDEMFLAGTTRNVVSIVKVDDHLIGSGKPGPVFKRLEAAFDKMLTDWLAAEAVSAGSV